MPRLVWTVAIALLLQAGFLAGPVRGETRAGSPFLIDVWEADEGLPENVVLAITQSREGYLWVGTLNGLVRFDGMRFTVFDENNTPGLPGSRIVSLFEDSHTNLWVGTETAGAAVIRNGLVTSVDLGRGSRDERLVAASEDSTGAVWLYTADGQLCRHRDGRFDTWSFGSSRHSDYRGIASDGPQLLIASETGLSTVLAKDVTAGNVPKVERYLPFSKLDYLLAGSAGGFWRLADGRITKWAVDKLARDLGAYPWGRARVAAACEDRQGNLVVGTLGSGLFWFDAEGNSTAISTNQGLSSNFVLSLLVDREGSLWVGTDGRGLDRVKRSLFHTLEHIRGQVAQSVSQDSQGGLWIGYNGGGVDHWRDVMLQRYGPDQGLVNASIRAVLADRDQARIWVGTWGRGVFELESGVFTSAPGASGVVLALYQDRQGVVWGGTEGGLTRWEGQEWKRFTTADGLSANVVRAITDDAQGALWIGTRGGGLNRLSDGHFTVYRKKDGLPSDDVSSLYFDSTGVLWIGTGSGLGRYADGKWSRFTIQDGLVSDSIAYLAGDDQGYLWIGSNNGLMRVARKSFDEHVSNPALRLECRTYGKADGLPIGECTSGSQPSVCSGSDGRLWFPTILGVASVDPAHLLRNPYQPPVMIESMRLEDRLQNTNRLYSGALAPVTIHPRQERIQIEYTSLNLAAPNRARFRYILDHYETKWTETTDRSVRYPKLPPGQYTFRVTACNEDGVWNENPAVLSLLVEPPFWRTWWFLSASALCLLSLIVGTVHRISTQRLQRQVERLRQHEALEKERARIARDIHDQLGASVTQVSLLGEFVEADKDSPTEVEEHGRQISQTAREITRTLDEIVWTVNPSNDTLDGLITYVCKYAQDYLAVADLRYRLDVPPQLPAAAVFPEVRHNLFLAAKEAVTNIVRHAKATSVWIRLKLEDHAFTLEIEDDGRGLGSSDPKAAQSRNGLRNMRKRMEEIGGSFSAVPAPEKGTIIPLTAPLILDKIDPAAKSG